MARTGTVLLATVVGMGCLVGAGTATATAAPDWNPQMTTTCAMDGTANFSTPLHNTPAVTTTAKVKWVWSNCTNSANQVTKGRTYSAMWTLQGSASLSCTNIKTGSMPALGKGRMQWNWTLPSSTYNSNTLLAGMKLTPTGSHGAKGHFTGGTGPATGVYSVEYHTAQNNFALCAGTGMPAVAIVGTVLFQS